MLTVQAYLQSPKTRKVLSKRPGEEGFSLIELVVVVAVLAILAAIAIPAFNSINDEARVAGAKTTLANLNKECAVKLAGSGATTYVLPTLNSYAITATGTNGQGTCSNVDVYTATPNNGVLLPTFILTSATGAKTCQPAGSGPNAALGCNNLTW